MIDHMIIQSGDCTLHIEVKGDAIIFSIQKPITPGQSQGKINIQIGALAIQKSDWSDINAFVRNECERQANLKNEGIKEDGKA